MSGLFSSLCIAPIAIINLLSQSFYSEGGGVLLVFVRTVSHTVVSLTPQTAGRDGSIQMSAQVLSECALLADALVVVDARDIRDPGQNPNGRCFHPLPPWTSTQPARGGSRWSVLPVATACSARAGAAAFARSLATRAGPRRRPPRALLEVRYSLYVRCVYLPVFESDPTEVQLYPGCQQVHVGSASRGLVPRA